MAGLGPAIHELRQLVIEVPPIGIRPEDQTDLPGAGPMLDVLLTLYGRPDVVMRLGVDQSLEAMLFREPLRQTLAMLPDPAGEVAGHTHVKGAIGPVGHEVNPSA